MRSLQTNFLFKVFTVLMFIYFFAVGFLLFPHEVNASQTDGTIDQNNKYAQALNAEFGIFNFGTANGNVHITDGSLTGFVWGNYTGWINLNPAGGGVTNNAEGKLSGYAWGQKAGWINFGPTNGGVTISSTGVFSGYAWGQRIGWIMFSCPGYYSCVKTDWVPKSARIIIPPPPPVYDPPSFKSPDKNPSTSPTPANNQPPSLPSPTSYPSSGGFGTTSIPKITTGTTPTAETAPTTVFPVSVSSPEQYTEVQNKETPKNLQNTFTAIINLPLVSSLTKTVSSVGILAALASIISSLFATPLSFGEIFLIPLRLLGLLLSALGLKKRHREWGTVYDSVTKQPLDPAYVVLADNYGKELSTSITDLDGRYGFLADEGAYTIVANKTNYIFPSKKLAGLDRDELYSNLYFGGPITLTERGGVINKNIPLDPTVFDWNEFQKNQQKLSKFYSPRDRKLTLFIDWFYRIGFIVALLALFAAPQPYNIITVAVYIFLLIVKTFGISQKSFGTLTELNTGLPLSYAIVRIISPAVQQEITHKVADKFGRYFCLVPPGKYIVKIEKKNPDESYSLVYESKLILAKQGIIHTHFKV